MKNVIFIIFSLLLFSCNGNAQNSKEEKSFPVSKTDAEWKAELSPAAYNVLRKKGTERAFSSKLNRVEAPGTFVCAACGNELYKTAHKFDSGTGWPSFDRPLKEENVQYRQDRIGGYAALEVICANCGSHLGHVFDDGPRATTGKRHCVNGVALSFIPEK